MSKMKKPLIILAGPTAVGKSALSIALAREVNGEIISADSMQVYQYMDIGSAKISKEEMGGIKHYLIDVLSPEEEFNVFRFQEMAKEALQTIYEKGKIPIIVGGTGFYIQALLYDINFNEEDSHNKIRKELELEAREKGNAYLHDELKKIDPISAELIHQNNSKRVIRAIEFFRLNGFPISEHNEIERQREAAYNACFFVLNDDREKIYNQIDRRVDLMIEKGLVDEVIKLKNMGYHRQMTSMQGLGYKELYDCLDEKCTLTEAIAKIKQETRHFAKRQLTWFRREKDVIWINKSEFEYDNEKIIIFMKNCLIKKNEMVNDGEQNDNR